MTDALIKSSLSLAYLDPIYRAGRGHEYIGTSVNDRDAEDLRGLISIVEPGIFHSKDLCLLNPTFGIASMMVGGADADVVIDNTMIDVKTTKKLELKREYFDQLLGYYVLHQFGGIGELEPKIEISKLGIYFSRHAYLHVFDLQDIINESTFHDFVQWFADRASQEYGTIGDAEF